jgi:PAS domain S-box-containing protein
MAAALTPNARTAIGGPVRAHATFRLGFAFLLSGLSIWMSVLLGGSVGLGVFPFLFPICVLSVWVGGILSGIVATVLLALGAAYYHLPPRGWYISNTADVIGLSAFVLSGFLVSWIVDSLQRSHSLIRAMLTSIGDAVISTDNQLCVQFMNPQAEMLTGWFSGEAEAKPLAEVLRLSSSKGTDVDVQGLLIQAIRECRSVSIPPQSFLAHKSGGALPIIDSIAPIREHTGKVRGVVVVFRDDTNRRRSEEALKKAETRYREIFENAVVGMFQSTPQGRYLRVNKAMASMHGYDSPEQMVDAVSDIWSQEFTDPNQRESFERLLNEHRAVHSFPSETIRRDGSRLASVVNARLVCDSQGNALYYEGTQEDVSDRKRLEAQLGYAQRLEAVGRLAGGIAHDFNNILGIIYGCCSLAQQRAAADDPIAKLIMQIREAGDRGAALVRQLLAFSRKQVVQPTVLDLNQVILKSSSMLERLVGEDIMITLNLEDKLDSVIADFGQLEQILMNFAVNSRDAMPHGGTIRIETRNVELDSEYSKLHSGVLPGAHVMFSFSDSGHGIDKDALPHIFEPFFTTKELGKGTGLGLATVYGIVKQHKGNIWVYSEAGRGTTFKIYLPRTGAIEGSTPADSEISDQRGTESILIVEDERSLLEVVATMLESSGYRVRKATSGAMGLEFIEQNAEKVDLLLTDVILRDTSGPELAAKVQIIQPGIKVVYMSGYTGDKLRDCGPLEVLEKPFTKNQLIARLRAAVESK